MNLSITSYQLSNIIYPRIIQRHIDSLVHCNRQKDENEAICLYDIGLAKMLRQRQIAAEQVKPHFSKQSLVTHYVNLCYCPPAVWCGHLDTISASAVVWHDEILLK